MKKKNSFLTAYVILFSFFLLGCISCNEKLPNPDKTASEFCQAIAQMDFEKCMSLSLDSLQTEISKEIEIAKGKAGGMYETITNEIKTYEVTTKIIKSETNKKEKTAVVTVFLKMDKIHPNGVTFNVSLRFTNKQWLIYNVDGETI